MHDHPSDAAPTTVVENEDGSLTVRMGEPAATMHLNIGSGGRLTDATQPRAVMSATEYELAHGNAYSLLGRGDYLPADIDLTRMAPILAAPVFHLPSVDGSNGVLQEVLSAEEEVLFRRQLTEDMSKAMLPTSGASPGKTQLLGTTQQFDEESLAKLLSDGSESQLKGMYGKLKQLQREYPMVMGRMVHVKKRASKTRKKKR